MNKRRIVKHIQILRPELRSVEDFYFYVSPLDHVLSGFFLEITPHGAYIWKLVFPLFDIYGQLHLTYSERLSSPEGYIDFETVPKSTLASEFSLRINDHLSGAYDVLSLAGFCETFQLHKALFEHEVTLATYGLAKVLLDQVSEAERAIGKASKTIREPYDAKCNLILDLLHKDKRSARNQILVWEADLKEKLKITSIVS